MRRIGVALLLLVPSLAWADPCGMVPPIAVAGVSGPPIMRVGPQRTYVFYEHGMETYVIRPGFSGKVDDFGMLIPFPSPPGLRKVPDEIFTQVAAAIDPPEVILDLSPRIMEEEMDMAPSAAASGAGAEAPLAYNEVKVLHEEAVGMYEVVVLAAGSAEALSKWMDEHHYRYPTGMDKVVNEYVKAGWVFVAERTHVGSKSGSDPKPGMRTVNPDIPSGSSFDGYVQAMGFRFKVDHGPVVPMRLSPFNEGEKRQIVYYLTDEPVRIDGVPTDLVKRQVPGWKLFKNLTLPLPVRVIGGTKEQVTPQMVAELKPQRDPKPHNGEAKDLFASDLLATKDGTLTLPSEEKEKELLRIGEALNMRGPEVDTLHEAELEKSRDATASAALGSLDGLTMTLVDGDFPLDYMETHDLTVSKFDMDRSKNGPVNYDASVDGPGGQKEGFLLDDRSGKNWYQKIWEESP